MIDNIENIVNDVKNIIITSKNEAKRSVNHHRTIMYWRIGERIFNEEQEGKNKAGYGEYFTEYIAEKLEPEFGFGFSKRQIELSRQFYRTFPIANTLYSQLNWSQYKLLIRLQNEEKRKFYMAECVKNNWTVRQLERQINSNLYERLLLSNKPERILEISVDNKIPTHAIEIIKDPMIFEFLDMKPHSSTYEIEIESALIGHLQDFLLELGNGFSFVARQKRIHIDGDDFFIDLVFYNRLLQCFVLLEIKTGKLNHQDLGQLQMYVNYYNRVEKLEHENPTIGILLCTDKNDKVVKFTLPTDEKNIIASKYELYLPSEKLLLEEISKQLELEND